MGWSWEDIPPDLRYLAWDLRLINATWHCKAGCGAPVTVALVIAAAAGNALEATPWWAADALPRVSARAKRMTMTAVLLAAEMRLFPASLSVSGLPAAAAAAAAAARALGAPLKIVAAAGAGRLVVGPAIAWLALAVGDVASNKELAAAWPAVAAGGAALFLSNKAGPLAAFMALAPLPWALARPEARITEDAFVASKSTRRAAAVAVGAHAVGACWARYQASDAALTFVTVMLQAAWALARRRALDDGASAKATGLLLCLGAGDACAALLGDFARGPALGLIMALLAAPGILLSSTPEAVFDDRQAHRSMAGALASLGLAAVALVVLTRLPAEGTALFESASIAAWALSARVAACWLPPDQILPRKACESLVAGAAAGALYLAHADATLLATIRLVCLAGALNSAGRAHVAGALLAAAVEAPRLLATAFLAASLALLGAAVRPPRRDASRFEDRVAARPDRAVVLAVRGLCGNQIYGPPPRHRRDTCSMAWRCRFLTKHRLTV